MKYHLKKSNGVTLPGYPVTVVLPANISRKEIQERIGETLKKYPEYSKFFETAK